MDIENAQQQPISGLPWATTFAGLVTIGTDSQNRSVKVPLAAVVNPPYIGTNGHWYVWNMSNAGYVDSGTSAIGATGQSAYDYAVEVLGFVGTIQEWYESMKGAALTFNDLTPAQKEELRGRPGADGNGISIHEVAYATTWEDAAPGTDDWSQAMPSVSVGQWLWTRLVVEYDDGTTDYFYTKNQRTANGKSAYDLAVEAGYQGTEQQFSAMLAAVGSNQNIWLTEDEFNALQTKDPNVTYNIYEEVDSL